MLCIQLLLVFGECLCVYISVTSHGWVFVDFIAVKQQNIFNGILYLHTQDSLQLCSFAALHVHGLHQYQQQNLENKDLTKMVAD